jgi:hypothetical protein
MRLKYAVDGYARMCWLPPTAPRVNERLRKRKDRKASVGGLCTETPARARIARRQKMLNLLAKPTSESRGYCFERCTGKVKDWDRSNRNDFGVALLSLVVLKQHPLLSEFPSAYTHEISCEVLRKPHLGPKYLKVSSCIILRHFLSQCIYYLLW